MEGLKPGRIVYVVLDEAACARIDHDRSVPPRTRATPVHPGDLYPAMVLHLLDDAAVSINAKVFLDGDDTYWATALPFSAEKRAGSWHWMFEGQSTRYQPDRIERTSSIPP